MYLLDTDHISILERGGVEAQRLSSRLSTIPAEELAVTVVSYEEQTRGWLAFMAKSSSLQAQINAYQRLHRHIETYCTIPVVEFDEKAAIVFRQLQKSRLRIGTMDLKIAAITVANHATLLTRNMADFGQVPNLRIEDWTV